MNPDQIVDPQQAQIDAYAAQVALNNGIAKCNALGSALTTTDLFDKEQRDALTIKFYETLISL